MVEEMLIHANSGSATTRNGCAPNNVTAECSDSELHRLTSVHQTCPAAEPLSACSTAAKSPVGDYDHDHKKLRSQHMNGPRRKDPADGLRLRAAGICLSSDATQVLLVTSSRSQSRWVIPGGGLEEGETSDNAVQREVLEEAGVCTNIVRNVGEFVDSCRKAKTQVYVLNVTEERSTWAEQNYGRKRRWVPIDEALCQLKPSQQRYLATVTNRPLPETANSWVSKHDQRSVSISDDQSSS